MITLQLAELAIYIPECIPLFENYGFNYYQNGNQTLKEACDEKGLLFADIDRELSELQRHSDQHYTVEDMDISMLIHTINGQHHHNEAETLAAIHHDIRQFVAGYPAGLADAMHLYSIDITFGELRTKLSDHCGKEDKLLFPQIGNLLLLQKEKPVMFQHAISKTISLINILEYEHTQAIQLLSEIVSALKKTEVPPGMSGAYQSLLQHFKTFEADFHMHIHIENNVLFPKIKNMSDQFRHLSVSHT